MQYKLFHVICACRDIMACSGNYAWYALLLGYLVCACNGERPDLDQTCYPSIYLHHYENSSWLPPVSQGLWQSRSSIVAARCSHAPPCRIHEQHEHASTRTLRCMTVWSALNATVLSTASRSPKRHAMPPGHGENAPCCPLLGAPALQEWQHSCRGWRQV